MKFRVQFDKRSIRARVAALVAIWVIAPCAIPFIDAPQTFAADDAFDALGDLTDELFRDLAPAPADDTDRGDANANADDARPPSQAIKPAASEKPAAALQLNPQDERHRILINMQLAQGQLAAGDASKKTQGLQQYVIDELQRLIEEAQSQQQPSPQSPSSGQGGSAANQNQERQDRASDRDQEQSPEAGTNDQQTNEREEGDQSTERLGASEASEVDGERRHALVRQAWGHLPARLREQMQQRAVEEFLPQYEELIGDYFLRLAEENAGEP